MSAEPELVPVSFDPADFPDVIAFGQTALAHAPKHRSARKLHALLAECDPRAERLERERHLIDLGGWMSHGSTPPPHPDVADEFPPARRLRLLVAALTAFPAVRARLARMMRVTFIEHSAEGFFARMGIPGDRGLLAETADRLSRRFMPQPIDEEDVTMLVARIFPRSSDSEWIRALPVDLVADLIELLRRGDEHVSEDRLTMPLDAALGMVPSSRSSKTLLLTQSVWAPLRVALLDAIQILATRTSSAGLSDALRARSPGKLGDSPFFRLPRTIDALLATPRQDIDQITDWADDCRAILAECGSVCDAVLARLEQTGVSVDVVYRLELIERSVARIELLLGVLVLRAPSDRARGAIELLAFLLEERRRDLSLVDIVRTTTHLLARKVIERAGDTGEHYITVPRAEYFKMLASAAGGGVLTGFTAALKVLIGKLHRPLLQEGLLSSMNYAGSFLLMQLCGFTLATKQPSMTAAALAGALKKDGSDREAIVTMIARVIRSQLAAALGNVVLVIPSAFAIDWLWRWRFGEHLLTREYSDKVVSSFHPTQSGTIPFAIITGVILWASSLSAGWLENWSAYRRLPEAIAEHRIRRVVGQKTTQWLSRVFAHNISGVGGNVSIGLMLGLTHSVGQFIGIPLDVRHVTLSTGSLTFAVLAQEGPPLATPGLVSAILGIVIILALNLGVSFTLALIVALRAREVGAPEAFRLAGAVLIGFVKSPLRFFLPVESAKSHAA